MQKRFTQVFVLLALIFISGMWYVFGLPDKSENEFSQGAAAVDTAVFGSYHKGVVSNIDEQEEREFGGNVSLYQKVTVVLEDSQRVQSEHTDLLDAAGSLRYEIGDQVIVGTITQEGETEHVIVDRYRLPLLWFVVGIFLALVIIFGRLRGFTALIGLAATGLVLLCFIAPQIIAGKDPFLVSLVGAGLIVLISMFIAHGFRLRVQLAALATLVTLAITAALSWATVHVSHLFGLGQSEAFVLQTGLLGGIDLRGVLLGGIIISVLGVLDDVTTSQTAAVDELYQADPTMSSRVLYNKAMSIGREHIASLINTLILVYAGASLPLFLLLTAATNQPIWVFLNSEYMAEEIVRALIGSIALIMAVPISTGLAALHYTKYSISRNEKPNP